MRGSRDLSLVSAVHRASTNALIPGGKVLAKCVKFVAV